MLQCFHVAWCTRQYPAGFRLCVLSFFELELKDDMARYWALMNAILSHLMKGDLGRMNVLLPEGRELNFKSKLPQGCILPGARLLDVLRR